MGPTLALQTEEAQRDLATRQKDAKDAQALVGDQKADIKEKVGWAAQICSVVVLSTLQRVSQQCTLLEVMRLIAGWCCPAVLM